VSGSEPEHALLRLPKNRAVAGLALPLPQRSGWRATGLLLIRSFAAGHCLRAGSGRSSGA